MNFDDTPQEAAFRAEAKAWIGANAPKQYEEELRKSSLGRTQLKGANILDVAKAWQKKKADAGCACLHWPREYGGRGAAPMHAAPVRRAQRARGRQAKKDGAGCSPNRREAPTSPACAPARSGAAMSGSSTARRSGPRARIIPTTASFSPAPIPMCPSTRGSPCSSWT